MSYRLFNISKQYFSKAKSENIRRFVICQIDLFVMQNILKENVDYIDFMNKVNILNEHNFLQEYVKGKLKFLHVEWLILVELTGIAEFQFLL